MEHKEISQAVIGRLPRYFRYFGILKEDGVERISSQELSQLMRVTASQIRQDFNNFGGFGQQGYGYNVNYLYEEIGKILGANRPHSLIVVGVGNLGQALINYKEFEKRGYSFVGAFDHNPTLQGKRVGNLEIQPMERLRDFIERKAVDIAVLAIPKETAVEEAARLVSYGIRGIWNFAHVDLDLPSHIQVENVHLFDSLLKLSYRINGDRTEENREG